MDQCKTNVVLSHDHIILTKDSRTLWCDRKDATLTAGYGMNWVVLVNDSLCSGWLLELFGRC